MMLNAREQFVKQTTIIWWLLGIGILGAVLMSALWDQTARVFGEEHSVGAYERPVFAQDHNRLTLCVLLR